MILNRKNSKLNKDIKLPNNKKGIVAIILFLILVLISSYSGDYICWSITITLGLLVFFSYLSVYVTYKNLVCIQSLTKEFVMKGDSTELVLKCRNKSRLFLIYAIALYKTPSIEIENLKGVTSFIILPNQSFSIKIKIHTSIKGVYDIGFLEMRITDYFGFFVKKPSIKQEKNIYSKLLTLVVTPAIQEIDNLFYSNFFDSFEESLNLNGSSETNIISDLRVYNYGDPLKRINWKATAKHQEIFVNNFENIDSANVGVYIGHLYNKDRINQLITEDYACECAASIINIFLNNKISATLLCDGTNDVINVNEATSDKYLYQLAETHIVTDENSLTSFKTNISSNLYFESLILILEFVNAELIDFIFDLKRVGLYIYLLLINEQNNKLDRILIDELGKSGIKTFIIPQGSELNMHLGGQI